MRYYVFIDGTSAYNIDVKDYAMIGPSVDEKINEASSFEFTIPPQSKAYDLPKLLKSTVMVVDSENNVIFYGRVSEIDIDFWKNKKVYCEGPLAWLNDSIQPVYDSDSFTIKSFLSYVLENHNKEVEDNRKVYLGRCDTDNTAAIYRTLNHELTYSAIKDMVLGTDGGYLYGTYEPSSVAVSDTNKAKYETITEERTEYYDENDNVISIPEGLTEETKITAKNGKEYTVVPKKRWKVTDKDGKEMRVVTFPKMWLEYTDENKKLWKIDVDPTMDDKTPVDGLTMEVNNSSSGTPGRRQVYIRNTNWFQCQKDEKIQYGDIDVITPLLKSTESNKGNSFAVSDHQLNLLDFVSTSDFGDKNLISIPSTVYPLIVSEDYDYKTIGDFGDSNLIKTRGYGVGSKIFSADDVYYSSLNITVNKNILSFTSWFFLAYDNRAPNSYSSSWKVLKNVTLHLDFTNKKNYFADEYGYYTEIPEEFSGGDINSKISTITVFNNNFVNWSYNDSSSTWELSSLNIISKVTFHPIVFVYLGYTRDGNFSPGQNLDGSISYGGTAGSPVLKNPVTLYPIIDKYGGNTKFDGDSYSISKSEPSLPYRLIYLSQSSAISSSSGTRYSQAAARFQTESGTYNAKYYYDYVLLDSEGKAVSQSTRYYKYFIDSQNNRNYLPTSIMKETDFVAKDGKTYTLTPSEFKAVLNYEKELKDRSNQSVMFGSNLKDISIKEDASKIYTELFATGKDDKTISSDNKLIIGNTVENDDYVKKFGKIIKTKQFDAAEDAESIKTEALKQLKNHQDDYYTVEATAIDLHYQNQNYDLYKIGQKVHIISKPHNIDDIFPIKEITTDLNKGTRIIKTGTPENDDLNSIRKPESTAENTTNNNNTSSYVVNPVAVPRRIEFVNVSTSTYVDYSIGQHIVNQTVFGPSCRIKCTYTNGNTEYVEQMCTFSPNQTPLWSSSDVTTGKSKEITVRAILYYNPNTGGLLQGSNPSSSYVSCSKNLTIKNRDSGIFTGSGFVMNNSVDGYKAVYGSSWTSSSQFTWAGIVSKGSSSSIGTSVIAGQTFTGWFNQSIEYGGKYGGSVRITDANGYPVHANTEYTNSDGTWKTETGSLYARYYPDGA